MNDTAIDKATANRFVAVGAGRMGRGLLSLSLMRATPSLC